MKPLSPHWADIAALRVVNARPNKERYVVASGITPSGLVHIGNFREVITVDLVARALKSLGKEVRFIYSWDNFDTFRKVPKNLPEPAAFTDYLRQPIARIPDPWGEASSYAEGRIQLFEGELSQVGISPDYLYQEQRYATGLYAENIRHALENKEKIRAILDAHRTSPLTPEWLPTSIYCERCSRDEMTFERYEGNWDYSYQCASCQHGETVDMRTTKNLKLQWRVDWPMRWHYEKVDFEPGGKDHSSQGGSFDTGKQIIKELWGEDAPEYLQYDFVRIKGGAGKMSSSSGELYTLGEVLAVYDPQIVRWIFASQRPNHDFAIAFDEDVIKIHDEFDRNEQQALAPAPAKPGKWEMLRRTYELSMVEGELPVTPPTRPSFRLLCNRLQICGGDTERTYTCYYANEITAPDDIARFHSRAKRAWTWIERYAPDDFKYALHTKPVEPALKASQLEAIAALRQLVSSYDLDTLEAKELNELLWEKLIHGCACDPKEAFAAVYQKLIGRDQGPRLPAFLKEIGKDKLLELL